MAIEQNLKTISTAVKGEDVREAIHDAIYDCYIDGKTGSVDLVARERIDNIAHLTEGSTTGDAELIDIRVGYDGTTYETAGTSVRSQVEKIKKELESDELISGSGNPVVLHKTEKAKPMSFTVNGASENTTITVCGKNIVQLDKSVQTRIRNGVRFDYNSSKGTVKISSTATTTQTVVSGIDRTINNSTYTCDFVFSLPSDCWITFHGNMDQFQGLEGKIHAQFIDSTKEYGHEFYTIEENGHHFYCRANVQYGIRYVVYKDFYDTNGVTGYPQIEIGTEKTNFEPYSGVSIIYNDGETSENIFEADRNLHYDNGAGVSWQVYKDNNNVRIFAETTHQTSLVHDPNNTTLNGITSRYLHKIRFTRDTTVKISGAPSGYEQTIYPQISDGTNVYSKFTNGGTFTAIANRDYGVRIIVLETANIPAEGVLVTPKVEVGLAVALAQNEVTTAFADDSATRLSLECKSIPITDRAETGFKGISPFISFTGGKIFNPGRALNNIGPIVSFIDDDTSSLSLVQRYHDILAAKGVVGNYAVITSNLDNDPDLVSALLEYEKSGFGMLYHVDNQRGDSTNYFKLETRDLEQCENNFVTGLRKMQNFGFCNYKYWVTPYGVNDIEMQNLARRYGMNCLISNANQSWISNDGLISRYDIPRTSLTVDNMLFLKTQIDACKAGNGWIILTTHVNTWTTNTPENNLKNIIDYVLSNNMRIVSFSEGFETRRALFYLNELF